MLSGELVYKQVKYHFSYEDSELRMDAIEPGGFSIMSIFASDRGMYLEEKYLIGECFSTGKKVVFIPQYNTFGASNSTMIITIQHMFIFSGEIKAISALHIEAIELDYIYGVNRCISYNFSENNRLESIQIHTQDEVTTKCGEI